MAWECCTVSRDGSHSCYRGDIKKKTFRGQFFLRFDIRIRKLNDEIVR